MHFVDRLPYEAYLQLLKVSATHVYLTYPFVLSWSLIEAMAAGCAIVAADTPGSRTVMRDGVQGAMVPIEGPDCTALLADACERLLRDANARRRAGEAGRRTAAQYDWSKVTRRVLDVYGELLTGRAAGVQGIEDVRRGEDVVVAAGSAA